MGLIGLTDIFFFKKNETDLSDIFLKNRNRTDLTDLKDIFQNSYQWT